MNTTVQSVLLLVVYIFFPTKLNGQSDNDFTHLQHIGMEQGLSSNKVNCIMQDKKGFMWIGTDYGLNRYDGYNFKVFLKNPVDSLSLTDNDIKCLTQDANGNIWIGTRSGLCVMDYKTEKIKPFVPEKNKLDSLWKYEITALASDSLNNVWVGTESRGLYRYNFKSIALVKYLKAINDTAQRFYLSRAIDVYNAVTSIAIRKNGDVYIGNDVHGLFIIKKETDKLYRLYLSETLVSLTEEQVRMESDNSIKNVFIDSKGNILIATETGGTSYDPIGSKYDNGLDRSTHLERFNGGFFINKFSENTFKGFGGYENMCAIVEFEPTRYLFAVGNKIIESYLSNRGNGVITKSRVNVDYRILNLYLDINKNIWVGTNNGIEILGQKKFRDTDKIIETNGFLQDLFEDRNGNLWMRGQNFFGLNKYSILLKELGKKSFRVFSNIDKKNNIGNIQYVDSNTLIYGIGNGELNTFNATTGIFRAIIDLKKETDTTQFNSLKFLRVLHTSNGAFWINSPQGFGEINLSNSAINYILSQDSIEVNYPMRYVDDNNGNFWIITSFSQIIKINYTNKTYKIFDTKKLFNTEIGRVRALAMQKNHTLWLGTDESGLFAFSEKENKLYHFTIANGLPSNNIPSLVCYDNDLWSAYPKGIFKFSIPEELENRLLRPIIKTFSEEDGIPEVDVNSRLFKSSKGEILIASDSILFSFNPDSIKSNTFVPNISITKLQINNNSIEANDSTNILPYSITSTDTLNLNYTQNNLSFEFAALNFIHPEENQYAYRFLSDNMDSSWIYCDKRRFVNFSNLEPGNYIFQVKGSNNDGVWNETGTSLHIFITPPYWQTGWFRFSSVAAFGLLLFGTYRWKVKSLRSDKLKLEKIVEQRTEEIKTEKQKSDELLLNILPAEVMEELKSTGKTQARNYDLVTVLFADFKDFTQIIDELPPEELVSGIDNYFETFDKIISKYPIEKIKTVGDAYICVAGLPQTSVNNPLVMMEAALEMTVAIEELKKQRQAENKIIFDVRIGVHSGPVVAGVVGIKKFAYDIWGDTVNTAARMQQHGEPGKINISGTTFGLIKHRYQCTHRGRIEVKSKGEVDMYFMEGKK